MREIFLVRHGKSYANVRDLAYGNVESPLNERGIEQAMALNEEFRQSYDINPGQYDGPVAASEYLRAQETAKYAGFENIDQISLINEATITPEMLAKGMIIAKHREERWVPDELQERASEFIKQVRTNELKYELYFTHGFFVAAVKDRISREHEDRGEVSPFSFDAERGFIPTLATITKVPV